LAKEADGYRRMRIAHQVSHWSHLLVMHPRRAGFSAMQAHQEMVKFDLSGLDGGVETGTDGSISSLEACIWGIEKKIRWRVSGRPNLTGPFYEDV